MHTRQEIRSKRGESIGRGRLARSARSAGYLGVAALDLGLCLPQILLALVPPTPCQYLTSGLLLHAT
eukprot:2119167-Rhodomonas_salina.2